MRERFLGLIVHVVLRMAPAVLLVAAVLTAISWERAGHVELRSSQLDMIPRDNPVVRRWIAFTEDFDILSDLFVIVRSKDLKPAQDFAIALKQELASRRDLVKDVDFKLDPALYENQALYFLPVESARGIRHGVAKQKDDLRMLAAENGFGGLMRVFRHELAKEDDAPAEEIRGFFGFIRDVAQGLDAAASGGRPAELPWRSFFGMGDPGRGGDDPFADGGWKLSTRKDALLIAVHPANSTDEFDFIVPFVEACRATVEKLKQRFPGVEVGLTGQPAMIYSQKDAVGNDLQTISVVSFVGVTLVFLWGFRGFGLPILALLSLIAGVGWSFGALSVSPGHLNLITIAFVSFLIGDGIDYAIYVATQFGERRRDGASVNEAVEGAIRSAGPGILTGSMTTCVGFLALMLTDFTGFKELGQIAGVGILLCMLAMLIVLPALLVVAGRFSSSLGSARTGLVDRWLHRLAAGSVEYGVPVLVFFLGGALFFGVEGLGVGFDYNLLNLEPEGTEAVVYERVMQREFEMAPDTLMVTVPTLDEAFALEHRLRRLPGVGNIDSLTNYLPDAAAEKRKLFRETAEEIRGIRFGKPAPLDTRRLLVDLDAVALRLRELKLPLLVSKEAEVVLAAAEAESAVLQAARAIRAAAPDARQARLARYEQESFAALALGFDDFRVMLETEPIATEKLPAALRNRFRGKSGRYALFVSPAIDARVESQAKLFIQQVSTVDPNVTGVPILIDEVMTLLKRGFRQATVYSLLAVILLVFADFRRIRETALALAPMVVSVAWTVGLMETVGVQYNPANFVSLPMLTGLGMAFGVYLIHRVLQDPSGDPVAAVQTTGKSILLSCLASLAGFGSLMLARNRGLWSLGWILFVGMTCNLIASLLMLPPLIELVGRRESQLARRARAARDALLGFRF